MKILNFKNTPDYESVIVIGGGPSSSIYREEIKKLLKNKDTTSISSNRKAPVDVDYMLFIDRIFFRKYINDYPVEERVKNIIVSPKIKVPPGINTNNIFLLDYEPKIKKMDSIKITSGGHIPHKTGGSGFACLMSSIFFKAKNIYIVGFDGDNDGILHHFDDCNLQMTRNKAIEAKKVFKMILIYLKNKNKNIYSFKDDRFWGLDKEKLGILLH